MLEIPGRQQQQVSREANQNINNEAGALLNSSRYHSDCHSLFALVFNYTTITAVRSPQKSIVSIKMQIFKKYENIRPVLNY